jgi:hypothetical protein
MATKKFITAEEAGRIWLLHEKGLTYTQIAEITGRSTNSVHRVVGVYKAVKSRDVSVLSRPNYASCRNIKAAAMKHFGMSATNADFVSGRGLKPLNQETKKNRRLARPAH